MSHTHTHTQKLLMSDSKFYLSCKCPILFSKLSKIFTKQAIKSTYSSLTLIPKRFHKFYKYEANSVSEIPDGISNFSVFFSSLWSWSSASQFLEQKTKNIFSFGLKHYFIIIYMNMVMNIINISYRKESEIP